MCPIEFLRVSNHAISMHQSSESQTTLEKARPVRVAVIQDGARLHYALPVALQRAGILDRVFTEWFVKPNSWEEWLSRLMVHMAPLRGRRMADRNSSELEPHRVITNPLLMMRQQLMRSRLRSVTAYFNRSSAEVGKWVLHYGLGEANALMGFIRNLDPGLCAACRERGLVTVGDQVTAPVAVELREGRLQEDRWPGWEVASEAEDSAVVAAHEERTWAALDHITCASEFVKHGLIEGGVNPARVSVIPYPIDTQELPFVPRNDREGPVTVGFVGSVSTRKGAPYFFETAKHFDSNRVRFVMVGPIRATNSTIQQHRGQVELIGAVPRSDIRRWLESFDIFFFPATCEGSAGALMEAMASGLPLVTTPNSGTVARHGREAFLAEYHQTGKLRDYINQLVNEPELRLRMGRAARTRAEVFTIDWYADQLSLLLTRLVRERVGTESRVIQ